MDINEWDLIEFLDKNRQWFTTKELILNFNIPLIQTEMVKMNRKIRQLIKANRINRRVCTREIAWRHEDEYRTKRK